MDFKAVYTNDLLAQAEQCFNDEELNYSFLKYIAQNSQSLDEAQRKLKRLRKRIGYLENKARNSFNEVLLMEQQAQIERPEQRYIFSNDEIYSFFADESSDEYLTYLKETATLERLNLAVRQLETLRTQSDKLMANLKKSYRQIKLSATNAPLLSTTEPKVKAKSALQLDRGIYKYNTGRF